MAPRIGLGLKPIDASINMQHGMAFIVKWHNTGINAKDLWLGIHVPNGIAPKRLTSNPKKNAQPETPVGERAYMFYLPGRNTYCWIERKCLFPLSEYSPEDFEADGREYHSLFKRLYDLIEEQEDLQFWVDMAARERAIKGHTGRQPYLVLPGDGSEGENELDGSEMFEHEELANSTPKRPRVGSKIVFGNKKAKTESRLGPRVDGEEIVMIFIGSGMTHKIYHLTRNKVDKSSFLKGLVQGSPPYVMHPALYEMKPDEFELVYAYLSSNEDPNSDLVPIGENLEELLLDDDHILGDTNEIGRSYWLKNVERVKDLEELIPNLEKAYTKAFSLGLGEMAHAIILKLQVAWNVYSGVAQLPLFLDFIENTMPSSSPIPAYQNVYVGKISQTPAFGTPSASSLSSVREKWVVGFLAETMMLYLAIDPQRFCNFMQQHPYVQLAVLARREQFCRTHLEHVTRLEMAFMQREPFKEGNFIHLKHGQTGQDGQDGEEGVPEIDGQNGQGDENGENGVPGANGQDGENSQEGA